MNRRLLASLVSIAFLYLGPSIAAARILDDWPYERLFKEADAIVIGTAVSTRDAPDTFVDDRWPYEFVGQDTTLEVLQVLKGEASVKRITVLHFKFGKLTKKAAAHGGNIVLTIDGPEFVSFHTKPEKIEIAGTELPAHRFEYLLFLKKRADGRYEPVSGRIDPNLSIRELFPPFFSMSGATDGTNSTRQESSK